MIRTPTTCLPARFPARPACRRERLQHLPRRPAVLQQVRHQPGHPLRLRHACALLLRTALRVGRQRHCHDLLRGQQVAGIQPEPRRVRVYAGPHSDARLEQVLWVPDECRRVVMRHSKLGLSVLCLCMYSVCVPVLCLCVCTLCCKGEAESTLTRKHEQATCGCVRQRCGFLRAHIAAKPPPAQLLPPLQHGCYA